MISGNQMRMKMSLTSARMQFFALLTIAVALTSCAEKKHGEEVSPIAIIPQPAGLKQGAGYFTIDDKTLLQVEGEGDAVQVGIYLADLISSSSTFQLSPQQANASQPSNSIVLSIKSGGGSAPGHYTLKVDKDIIAITGTDAVGLFYGVQTLRQLLPPAIEQKATKHDFWLVPAVSIDDNPAYAWRGMHLDVSRHFFSVDFIKTFIDRLALYKFNKLHLHLTDDQGWRLQIKAYPELTEEGAWRTLNNQDSACLKLAAGNDDFSLPHEFFKTKNGKEVYGGFYTHEDIRDIVSYATKHYITIIPEIDMPGHMNAAVIPMPELTCLDSGGWGKLFTVPLCPCEESTYQFVGNVLKEVATLFPGEYIHIGADEVDRASWLASAPCQVLMKKRGFKTSAELQGYFVDRVNNIVRELGKKTIGWDEILDSNESDTTITTMYWRGWIKDAPQRAIANGHDLIMCPTSHCYFDYQPDHTTLEHTYAFDPAAGLQGDLTRLLGLQADIWTEYIPTAHRLDYMTMPRMMALAEVGWRKTKDWNDFAVRAAEHYNRLDVMNVHYRLPDLANMKTQKVFIDTATISLLPPRGVTAIRYTLDGTEPDTLSALFDKPITIDSSLTLNVKTYGFQGRLGNRYTVRYEKQRYLPGVVTKEKISNGLKCLYYEGEYNSVNKIKASDLVKSAMVDRIEFPSFVRQSVFALAFEGFIEVPETGIYTFYLSSDDGSVLQIGDRMVIDHDGFHGGQEKSGQIALEKGLHPIVLRYFDGGGGNSLKISYEGPGISKQEVPGSVFKMFPK
jgi:hexosaminidase